MQEAKTAMYSTPSDSIKEAVLKQQFKEFSAQMPKAYIGVAITTGLLFWQFRETHFTFVCTTILTLYAFLGVRLFRVLKERNLNLTPKQVLSNLSGTNALSLLIGTACSLTCFVLAIGAKDTHLFLLGGWGIASCMCTAALLSAIPQVPQLMIVTGIFPFQAWLLISGSPEIKIFAMINIIAAVLILALGNRMANLLHQLTLERADQKEVALAAETEMNNFIETVDKISWRSDAKDKLIYASQNTENVFGIPRNVLLGRDPYSILLLASGENDKSRRQVKALIDAREQIRNIPFVATRTGARQWFTVNGEPRFEQNGTFIGYIGWIIDVTGYVELNTETVRQQNRLRAMEALGRGWDWTTDENKRFSFISPRCKDLTGHDLQSFIGLKLDPLLCPDNEQTLKLTNALMSEQSFKDIVLEYKPVDRPPVQLLISALANYNETGKFTGYSGISFLH